MSRNPYTIFCNINISWWSLKKINNGLQINHDPRALPDGMTTVHTEPTNHLLPMRSRDEETHPVSSEKKVRESAYFLNFILYGHGDIV